MRQNELMTPPGSRHSRKRVGRGDGSGHGSYSGKGCKGQKARSGQKLRSGFEGGQLPIVKRLPEKRGFNNRWRVEYNVVNVGEFGRFEAGTEVTPELLARERLVGSTRGQIKVLGNGEIATALTVKAHSFSASAKGKIEAAGGRVEVIERASE
ncbi:MAG: 50S ribosomal protein L15 [Chloroflexi bacterium]|nr:50S ribosomal protein L15 [Chloroflexota bacterium]